MTPNLSTRHLTAEESEVFREAADIAAHECLRQAHRWLPRARLRRLDAANSGMTVLVAIHHEKPLLVVVEVEPVENSRVVGRDDDLFVVFLRKHGELLYQSDAQLRVEGCIDVVDREEGRRLRADEEREVEEEEEEPLVRAPLIEQGAVGEEAISNPDAPLPWTEIIGDHHSGE